MLVTLANLPEVVGTLQEIPVIGADTETYGLRPYHGDRLFSIAMVGEDHEGQKHRFYFNFHDYLDSADGSRVPERFILPKRRVLDYLSVHLFRDPDKEWAFHNARYDLHILAVDHVPVLGRVHCTQAIGRVEYNSHRGYKLEDSLERIGLEKDPAVENYIDEHGLFEMVKIPGRKKLHKDKFYWKVPLGIIMPYALIDADGALVLRNSQVNKIAELDAKLPADVPRLRQVLENENQLIKTLQTIEANGCRIDRAYSLHAVGHFEQEMAAAQHVLEVEVGTPFKNSEKFFLQAFKGHEHEFTRAEKKGFSFDKKALKKITHPLVEEVLRYRSSKNRLGFFQGFLYHADEHDLVHPSFNPDRALHGRLSSSNPNFQNLKKDTVEEHDDEDEETEIYVRRAIIPREGNVLLMPDYIGMEYAMALEYACRHADRGAGRLVRLAELVNDGLKFHNATVQLVKEKTGIDLAYSKAKVANFLSLYEGGPKALAEALGCSVREAEDIQLAIAKACPELIAVRRHLIQTAKRRGFLFNWFGRRCWFPVSQTAYRGPNHVFSGGCADVMKIAMNRTQGWVDRRRCGTKIIMTVHDELVLDTPRAVAGEVAHQVRAFMEGAFPAEFVPMKVDMAWSAKSLADKVSGMPA